MTYRGEIHNGAIVLDAPIALPEGSKVECVVVPISLEPTSTASRPDNRPIWERIAERAAQISDAELADLPTDGASQHDHYLYGSDKRPA